jgi:hypothetical protein
LDGEAARANPEENHTEHGPPAHVEDLIALLIDVPREPVDHPKLIVSDARATTRARTFSQVVRAVRAMRRP